MGWGDGVAGWGGGRRGSKSVRDTWVTSYSAELELSRQFHRQWRRRHVSASSLGTSVVFSSPFTACCNTEPLEINKRKKNKRGAVVVVRGRGGPVRLQSRLLLSAADCQRGPYTYKLPSEKPKADPVRVWLHWTRTSVNFLIPAMHTLSSDKARWVCFTDTHLLKCSPFLNLCASCLTFTGLWLSGAGQLHVACLKWRQPTWGGGRESSFFKSLEGGTAYLFSSLSPVWIGRSVQTYIADKPFKLGLTPPNLSGRWTRIIFRKYLTLLRSGTETLQRRLLLYLLFSRNIAD